ncbi:MAG TPA: hypothetical protein VLX59_03390 [Acidimicrobiales bacterium]|nr:hypothetical protein [Acidimicrobiales bacterium]
MGWSETAYHLDWLHTFNVCGPCDAFHASLLTHQFSGAGEGSMLIAPLAELVEKIGSAQIPEPGTALAVLAAGTVVAVVAIPGATVVCAATLVVVDGTLVLAGASVTGTTVAGGSPTTGVVVADAATW